uniref:G-protein coupled receptors family 1 profile domain-containing protein n=1 Tax=Parascaris univalens TaxID=6257 RepID=A0A915BD82_PARUN
MLCMGVSSATIFFPRAAPLECSVLHCQKLLGFAVVLTFSLFYMIVVSLYIAMLWRINKRKERDRALWYSSVRAMKRLALQLSAFIISGTPIVATSSFTLAHLDQIDLLGLETGSPCSFLVKGRLFGQAERLLCINVSAWILPMISAPLISCYFDANKREVIRHKLDLKCGSMNNHQSSARSVT